MESLLKLFFSETRETLISVFVFLALVTIAINFRVSYIILSLENLFFGGFLVSIALGICFFLGMRHQK